MRRATSASSPELEKNRAEIYTHGGSLPNEMTKPLFLFAPGAGAPSSHHWMEKWRTRLTSLGEVVSFDYSYMREGRRRPDRLPELVAAHREALHEAQRKFGTQAPVILIGKSMGGRVGCHLSLEEPVAGLVCLGYPLCAMGDRTKLRDEVLRRLTTPILFVQGTRDKLCPLDLLEQVRGEMKTDNQLFIVPGGDHSLGVGKRELAASGQTQADIDRQILDAIAGFVSGLPARAALGS